MVMDSFNNIELFPNLNSFNNITYFSLSIENNVSSLQGNGFSFEHWPN